MRKLAIVVLLAASAIRVARPARAQEGGWDGDAESARPIEGTKAADIRKLLEITGAAARAKQVAAGMIPSMQKLVPAPDSFWQEFVAEIDEEELLARIVPIYDRHLSHEDVKALLAFYGSPTGNRLIQVTPLITSESMAAGQEWGQELGRRVMRRIEARQEALDDGSDEGRPDEPGGGDADQASDE